MSQDKQFLKFVAVQGEKHLGVAVVRWLGKIILRYKVMPSQEGGYWIAAGSTKLGVKRDGKENYEEWFQLDSTYERDEMRDFILDHIEPILSQKHKSVFAQPLPVDSTVSSKADSYQSQNNDDFPF